MLRRGKEFTQNVKTRSIINIGLILIFLQSTILLSIYVRIHKVAFPRFPNYGMFFKLNLTTYLERNRRVISTQILTRISLHLKTTDSGKHIAG